MRVRVALRNLVISQAIIIVFLIFAYFVWFPYSFSILGGFYETALLLIFVDLVLGPLLVLIVYKKNKKYLTFDINVLLSIQLIAFLYGAYALYLKHPVYTVFSEGQFRLVNASYIEKKEISIANINLFFSKPQMVVTKPPKNTQEYNNLIFSVLFKSEHDIDERPEYYKPYHLYIDEILSKQLDHKLVFKEKTSHEKLKKFIIEHGGTVNDYAFYPVTGNNNKEAILVVTQENIKPVDVIDIAL